MTRKAQRTGSLERRKPFRTQGRCILIVCEGEKTEPDYFKSLRRELRLRSVKVEVVGKECGSAPINVVDEAIKKKDSSKSATIVDYYDEIWCVMDVEAPQPHTTLDQALDKARDNGLKVALTNPCFEYWYILHFKKTSQFMQKNGDVIKVLKKCYPEYCKNSLDIFDAIFPHTTDAIKNAGDVIKEKHWGEDLRGCNPSTHVHRLVEQLMSFDKHS
ncbi:MAG: RloB domain-containing protein [Phycisphaerae bacterium]|nr:RloB domain-containing protein [Phycisphaerae bacterium]